MHHFASSSLLKPRRVHKSCDDMSQCTSIGSADASISRRVERDGSANPNEEVPGVDLPGGMKALHLPKSWPLARLTIPASKHLERLLEGCCNEIYVRNTNPDLQLHFVRKFAKDLVVVLAFHLAETIAALFRLYCTILARSSL